MSGKLTTDQADHILTKIIKLRPKSVLIIPSWKDQIAGSKAKISTASSLDKFTKP